jgi:hypothetical protein
MYKDTRSMQNVKVVFLSLSSGPHFVADLSQRSAQSPGNSSITGYTSIVFGASRIWSGKQGMPD